MKARIILLLLVCFSCTAFAQSDKTIITSWGQISLAGDWKGGDFGDRSDHRSIVCMPVGASLENAIITLDFQEAADKVTVIISNESQTVLSHSLSVYVPSSYSIPVNTFAPGVYLLEISNSCGGYIYGWFELK